MRKPDREVNKVRRGTTQLNIPGKQKIDQWERTNIFLRQKTRQVPVEFKSTGTGTTQPQYFRVNRANEPHCMVELHIRVAQVHVVHKAVEVKTNARKYPVPGQTTASARVTAGDIVLPVSGRAQSQNAQAGSHPGKGSWS